MAAVVAAAALAGGRSDVYAGDTSSRAERAAAPAWTRPCWLSASERGDGRGCRRVEGRVVWREAVDADGDGDRHLVVVARFHVHVVKLPAAFPVRRLPRLGARVTATGAVFRGSSAEEEIRAERFTTGGRTVRASER